MKKITPWITLILGVSLLLLPGCETVSNDAEDKPVIAVSIVPQETFVRQVAGDRFDIVTLIPPGKSPANYAPSPQELEKLSHASVYFTIGVPAEKSGILPKLSDINPSIQIIHLADEVKNLYPEREFSPGERDPHIWLSPKRAAVMAEVIADALSDLDKENASEYRNQATQFIEELLSLDEGIKTALDGMTNKGFIIFHPSLGYFAEDYDLTMIPIEADGKEASPEDLKNIIDLAKLQGLKTIFYQSEIDSRQSEVFANEIQGKTVQISPLSADYIENLEQITQALIDSFE